MTMAHAFIRPYESKDFDATAHICRETLPPSLHDTPHARRLAPYIWTHPYTHLSPSTCLVLDDGTGRAVGYCIGCPDVEAFARAENYARYLDEVLLGPRGGGGEVGPRPEVEAGEKAPWMAPRADGGGSGGGGGESGDGTGVEVNEVALRQLAYDAEVAVLRGTEVLWETYGATMHIDLLGPWQGKGWGRKLIEAFVESVKAADREKSGGTRVYKKGIWIGVAGDNGKVVPFYEKVGFRVREGGEKVGTMWMVKDIE
ncbi:hypothetical protein SODALDRAFT_304141 [Sodiomyces alkalinus F11]|uniref:N-acetyltransferase domain-containing protein n=1 Tax=Sodiomyces alkalinus (strain CBS 110278 / VKM F-3762 / F11) TaxID=1314773 RepID=A0A3N2Q7N1_SODAK|nr:hypothetical protein SODALDRAFT_304141 [Sodiomyces alkalinus F11]ROT42687.1 hypothetical protein SODALDRAFT_304141 [Sodiomyces alkalinus F11]